MLIFVIVIAMIHLKHLLLLASVGTLLSYGICFYIYIVAGLLSFAAGYAFSPHFYYPEP